MEKFEKGIQFLMWAAVVLTILIFFATIILGHADYNLLYSIQNVTELKTALTTNNHLLL